MVFQRDVFSSIATTTDDAPSDDEDDVSRSAEGDTVVA